MSSKIEVSRELIAAMRKTCKITERQWDELNAACAAPVVERQLEPVAMQWQYEAGSEWWAFDAENVGDNIASGTKIRPTDLAGNVLFSYPAPELAELQTKWEKAESGRQYQIELVHEQRREIEELQATIARLTAELTEVKRHKHAADVALEAVKFNLDKTDKRYLAAVAEIERLKGGQGEPVAEVIEHYGFDDGIIRFKTSNMEQLPIGTLLYTSQPAPVSVVPSFKDGVEAAAKFVEKRMDDYVNEHGSEDPETGSIKLPGTGDEYVGELMEIVESIRAIACLDKVKELNQ